jgi:hypothetical protein
MVLIFFIVIFSCSYHFLNWNCFSISSLMIWFYFLFVSNLVLFLFKSTFSNHFLNLFFSSLSLIILIGIKFYIVIFLGLPFTLWFSLMIYVINFKGWTKFDSIIFLFFKKISSIIIEFVKNWFSLFFYVLDSFVNLIFPFNSIFFYI